MSEENISGIDQDDDGYTYSPPSDFVALDASVDGQTGTAANGKPIWSPAQIALYLNRTGGGFSTGPNNGPQSDADLSVIKFGFHESQDTLWDNGYVYAFNGGLFGLPEFFNFAAFSPAQRDAAREALQSWDDVIAVSLQESDINSADIAFGNLASAPTTQAYAYVPTRTISSNAIVNAQVLDIGGDVWVSLSQPSNLQLDEGRYGMQTLAHEIGHALGLSHPGAYNAAPGVSITYPVNAEYYQDNRVYTIMSYFDASAIGARAFDFNLSTTAYAGVPLIHDILAAQRIYGADMTTRTGDTVYGFNSNAGRDTFDFVKTPAPLGAIWDAGGIDTIDTSGFATTQLIDLHEGSLSSIGGVTYDTAPSFEQVNANRAANGFAPIPRSTYDANMAALKANAVVGRLTDNFGIAYGVTIENAIGGSGADTILGNDVDNVLTGNAGDDVLTGNAGNDTLFGGVGADKLNGGTGNDLLDGGAGADQMTGGTGDDSYVVDDAGDLVTENAGEGVDRVTASISYALAANVENLILAGAAANGTGNELDNAITGNELANVLTGGAGNDTLIGNGGDDVLDGGLGADQMTGGTGNDAYVVDDAGDVVVEQAGQGIDQVSSSISYTLGDNVENLILTGGAVAGGGNGLDNVITGNELANTLTGGAGNDTLYGLGGNDDLDGGAGADKMVGGSGNDTYHVDNGGDLVVELGGEGTDTVISAINYTLPDNVENLVLSGSAADAWGNALDNVLTGDALSNHLYGGAGADRLIGGDGLDYLTGGSGNDVFVAEIGGGKIGSKAGAISVDMVLDFKAGEDKIDLHGIDANSLQAGFQSFNWVGQAAGKGAGDLSINHYGNMDAAEKALGMELDGVDGKSPFDGPVTVVSGNVDGGAQDFAMVFVNTPTIHSTDFIF
ncbi:MAG: M10 family metallopeptidase C-terminal domain-containing protein [Alphaproteobacteria bacterium]|nr:M10 family metallopeptidase C-terminal domain-containing protein [Alphaproteobacteria bacterium]MBV9371738.1 M10 family metallopeptidase C-terminal domain-containing protein [Alphaproteobacteria bacterium]MBV9902514.1 M10 family metallopeptidase C-terminal domain-containing protein [Alphaproteobacteria bacterium]